MHRSSRKSAAAAVLVRADPALGSNVDSAEDRIRFRGSDPVASRVTAVPNKRSIILEATTMMDPSVRNIAGIEQRAVGLREPGVTR